LSSLTSDDASVVLEDVVCSLSNRVIEKVTRDDLITTREEARQMVLLEGRKQYKAKPSVVARRHGKPGA